MSGGKRPGSGRRAVAIDLGELEKVCGLQCTDEEVAAWFKVSVRTIERRKVTSRAFAEAMARGKAKGKTSLRRNLWTLAAKGNPAANIFLAKNLLGYRDYLANEHSGPDGGPILVTSRPDLKQLSHDELQQLRGLVAKAQPTARDRN
ncbi:MAG: hypothetical protein ABI824_13325 [Acidobacteriota bacterium]